MHFENETPLKDLQFICYVSSAVEQMSEPELEALLSSARAFNVTALVTGVLLQNEDHFFQYFEGPAAGLEAVYDRIKSSHWHTGIIELLRAPIEERAFPDWRMGSTRVSKSALLSLRTADWRQLRARVASAEGPNLGLVLLRGHLEIAKISF